MHLHILGIAGTFMGSLAQIAKASGHHVTGADKNVYPPMSTQLQSAGIELVEGYDVKQLECSPDLIIVGNVMTRGMPIIEYILNKNLPYTSGPQWLYEHILKDKWVLAVSGTHGKTTTASMLSWILECAGMNPGFLIGGVCDNLCVSARLTDSSFFVIEADEYDTAFFDKRSKFVHYHPRTLVINNLEYDHADIFADLKSIQTQFHHLIRVLAGDGLIIAKHNDKAVMETLEMGCWTELQTVDMRSDKANWSILNRAEDGQSFDVILNQKKQATLQWNLLGDHNIHNGLSAIAAARHVGVLPQQAIESLSEFKGVKRRMELKAHVNGVYLYDDFAHHPTAIKATLAGLKAKVGNQRIIAIVEPGSNTMKMGVHNDQLLPALEAADLVWLYKPEGFELNLPRASHQRWHISGKIEEIIESVCAVLQTNDHILVMSNSSFQGLHDRLLVSIKNR